MFDYSKNDFSQSDGARNTRQLKKLKEEEVYESLVKSTLENMSETKGGEYCILPRGALQRATEIFRHLKLKHIDKANEETLTDSLENQDKVAISLLENKQLKWSARSNLGLKMMDLNEPLIQME